MTAALRECRLLGVGAYRPRNVIPNSVIAEDCGVTDTWISSRTGIRTRSFAGTEDTLDSMALSAARDACLNARIDPVDLDCVVLATLTQTRQVPALAPSVAYALGARRAMALDLSSACSGFCYSLAAARDFVRVGTAEHVLVIGVERMSDVVDPTDRATAPIFGDGAGAAVVGPADEPGIGPVVWGSDGSGRDAISMSAPWDVLDDPAAAVPHLDMEGADVWRWIRNSVVPALHQAIAASGLRAEELAAFIPHQANGRIIDMVVKQLGLPAQVTVAKDIERAGNTSAASIPLAMHALLDSGAVASGQPALLAGFGAGLTHAAQVVRLP
jgi:3-oxoacyl-(acyl-carrier-protein) synthase III